VTYIGFRNLIGSESSWLKADVWEFDRVACRFGGGCFGGWAGFVNPETKRSGSLRLHKSRFSKGNYDIQVAEILKCVA
jgi:hypothetical protein